MQEVDIESILGLNFTFDKNLAFNCYDMITICKMSDNKVSISHRVSKHPLLYSGANPAPPHFEDGRYGKIDKEKKKDRDVLL